MRIELTRPNGHYPLKVARLPIPPPGHSTVGGLKIGAKNGTRTRDPDLGKVVLYQLSYFRILIIFAGVTLSFPSFALQSYNLFLNCANLLSVFFVAFAQMSDN